LMQTIALTTAALQAALGPIVDSSLWVAHAYKTPYNVDSACVQPIPSMHPVDA